MKLLDLFCGRLGWSRAFAKRGWQCTGVDLVRPEEVPPGCWFVEGDVLKLSSFYVSGFDFVVASSPCEEFSVHGMKHFHPNPKYPEMGIRLFNHTRRICEEAGVPYVMENVKAAQKFVGPANNHCGSFHLWGNAVPPLMPQGISKAKWTMQADRPGNTAPEVWGSKRERARKWATIPDLLANAVADYAEQLLLQETRWILIPSVQLSRLEEKLHWRSRGWGSGGDATPDSLVGLYRCRVLCTLLKGESTCVVNADIGGTFTATVRTATRIALIEAAPAWHSGRPARTSGWMKTANAEDAAKTAEWVVSEGACGE